MSSSLLRIASLPLLLLIFIYLLNDLIHILNIAKLLIALPELFVIHWISTIILLVSPSTRQSSLWTLHINLG